MPIDPSIPLAVQPIQLQSPLSSFSKALQLRSAQENMQAQAEQRRLLAEQRQNTLDDRASLDAAVTPNASLDDILGKLPGHMHAAVKKQWLEADEAAGKARDAKAKAGAAEADYFGTLAATLKSYNYDPATAQIVLSHAKAEGHDTSAIEQLIGSDPSKLPAVVDSLIAASPKQRELANNEKSTAETGRHALVTEGQAATTATETNRHNLQLEAASEAVRKLTASSQSETKRHNLQTEKQAADGVAADASNVPSLTPAALDVVANNFAMTGQLPPMGNSAKAGPLRSQIMNRAAELYKGLDLPSQRAAFTANQGSLKTLTAQRDAVGAFEGTALKNLDQFLTLAGKVPDTGSPWINSPIRAINERVAGSEHQAAFNAARTVVIPEFAKIISNPGLSGQLSDAARHEVEEVLKPGATFKQIKAVAALLKTDAANRRTSIDDQIAAISKRIAAKPGDAAPDAKQVDPLGIR